MHVANECEMFTVRVQEGPEEIPPRHTASEARAKKASISNVTEGKADRCRDSDGVLNVIQKKKA